MTKQLVSNPPELTLPFASLSDGEPVRRLLVLIPDAEFDPTPVLQRIWEMANAARAHIRFLGLCKEMMREASLRRKLVNMSALIQGDRISAEAKVEIGTNWIEAVRRNYLSGDVIVCFEEQRTGLLHRPLKQILNARLDAPVYILSNVYQQRPKSNWTAQIVAWSGSLIVIIGFGVLQVKIVQLPRDGFQSVLLILSIIPEFWLVWVWNSLLV